MWARDAVETAKKMERELVIDAVTTAVPVPEFFFDPDLRGLVGSGIQFVDMTRLARGRLKFSIVPNMGDAVYFAVKGTLRTAVAINATEDARKANDYANLVTTDYTKASAISRKTGRLLDVASRKLKAVMAMQKENEAADRADLKRKMTHAWMAYSWRQCNRFGVLGSRVKDNCGK